LPSCATGILRVSPHLPRDTSRARVNGADLVRCHVCLRDDPASGALSPSAPEVPLSRRSGLPRARSPSLPIAPPRAVHARRRQALLWIRPPPNDFCNLLPTHGHTPEHPILAFPSPRVLAWTPNLPSFLAVLFRVRRPSPLEEGSRALRAETALLKPARRRCKRAAKRDPGSQRPIDTPLAGDASIRPPFAAMAVGR